MNTINTFDEMLKETYQRAKRKGKKGDRFAGHFLLVYLHNALRETGGAELTDTCREILAAILREIIDGKDARDATFTHEHGGNPAWKNQVRNQKIIGEMAWRVKGKKMKPWPAAGEIADKIQFTDRNGNPLSKRHIYNMWNDRKDDPNLAFVFKGD
jgi:hypothetical protein